MILIIDLIAIGWLDQIAVVHLEGGYTDEFFS